MSCSGSARHAEFSSPSKPAHSQRLASTHHFSHGRVWSLSRWRPFDGNLSQATTPVPSPRPLHRPHLPRAHSSVLIIGSGNFGACLADHLANSEHNVFIFSRREDVIRSLNEHHRHPTYLKEHTFPASIKAVGPALPEKELLLEMDVLLFAIPTQALRQTLASLHAKLDLNNLPLLIFVNKGIEQGTNALSLEIIADECGADVARMATFISGPSFAAEIVQRQPTSVSVSSLSTKQAELAAALFHQPWFRCYTGGDPIGVELAGALKNVYAIATGIAAGLQFEQNARAAIITRSLAEMTQIGVAYGASPLTFLSLAGVGDLFLTCSSAKSRNYTVGYRLGKGERLETILETLGSIAEGVSTTYGVKSIVDELGLRASIVAGVHNVLQGADVAEQAKLLLSTPSGPELELPSGMGAPARKLLQKLGMGDDWADRAVNV